MGLSTGVPIDILETLNFTHDLMWIKRSQKSENVELSVQKRSYLVVLKAWNLSKVMGLDKSGFGNLIYMHPAVNDVGCLCYQHYRNLILTVI